MENLAVNLIASPKGAAKDQVNRLLQSGKKDGGFFPMIRNLMNPAQKGPFQRASKLYGSGIPMKGRHPYYLESLRTRLLAKGRPLNELSIKKEDLPLLQKFLHKCGFSKEDTERILEGLERNDQNGQINLSQFFLMMEEYSPPEQNSYDPLIIEPSAVPRIESVLRDFGLTPKEVGQAFESSQIEAGLNLNILLQRLKEISQGGGSLKNYLKLDHFVKTLEDMVNRSTGRHPSLKPDVASVTENVLGGTGTAANNPQGKNNVVFGHDFLQQMSKKIDGLGIQDQNPEKSKQVSVKDIMTALAQVSGKSGKEDQAAQDVTSTIDRILEKVVLPGKGRAPSTERQNILASLREKGGLDTTKGEQGVLSAVQPGKVRASEDKNISAELVQEAKASNNDRRMTFRPPSDGNTGQELQLGGKESPGEQPKAFGLPSDGNAGHEALQGAKESANTLRSETGTINISQDLNISKGRAAVQEQQRPIRDSLPSYLVDQVGKQISRSIQRGQSALRLQLKPPHLGSLRVEVDMKDNILKLGMTAENSTVKDILLSNVRELKEALSEQGVKLDKIDIDINNNAGQSMANLKDGSKEGLNGGQRRMQHSSEGSMSKDEGAGDDAGSEGRAGAGGSSQLDLMA